MLNCLLKEMFVSQQRWDPLTLNIACSDISIRPSMFSVSRRFARPTSLRKSFEEMAVLSKFNHVNFEKKWGGTLWLSFPVSAKWSCSYLFLFDIPTTITRLKPHCERPWRLIKMNYSHSLILYTDVFKIYPQFWAIWRDESTGDMSITNVAAVLWNKRYNLSILVSFLAHIWISRKTTKQ